MHVILRRVSNRNLFLSWRKLLSILLASAVVGEMAGAIPYPGQRVQRSAPRFEELPLVRSKQNHLLVHAYINGKPAWLCVDSGAPISAIDLHRRSHFRLTGISTGSEIPTRLRINGAFDNVAIARSLQLGGLNLVDEPVVVVDLEGSSRAASLMHEPAIDGILGADILFPTKAVLDCKRQVLILQLDPEFSGRAPGVDFRGLYGLPMHLSESFNLYVDGSINGTPARLMVDTGAFATLLHQAFVRQMRIPTRTTQISSAAVNLKQRGVLVAKIRRLALGNINIVGEDVGVINLEGLIHNGLLQASPPVVGLLGAATLREHQGIIDFGTRTLYLKR
ncbi:MAG TPA: aspartyl protease family protein [Chthoniobacterales bacterium]|nr:aspartyl protease family protein [Chthoniobacterales bacterium]